MTTRIDSQPTSVGWADARSLLPEGLGHSAPEPALTADTSTPQAHRRGETDA
jgi:hypothetical protein